MQLKLAVAAASLTACQACNPLSRLFPPTIKTWRPDALPAHFPAEISLTFDNTVPTNSGLTIWAADGSEAASINCEVNHEPSKHAIGDLGQVLCTTPALPVGTYTAKFSGDRSCGPSSYKPLDSHIDVIEPAHVVGSNPSHGPEKAATTIKVSGSNLGGPHMGCKFVFPPADGAKIGCSMGEADYGAFEVTSTSAVCHVPKWPGPVKQSDGHGGFKPAPGAKCSREVHLQITNDARVWSQEQLVFRYDDASDEELLV